VVVALLLVLEVGMFCALTSSHDPPIVLSRTPVCHIKATLRTTKLMHVSTNTARAIDNRKPLFAGFDDGFNKQW
jgi:hypothetical protein